MNICAECKHPSDVSNGVCSQCRGEWLDESEMEKKDGRTNNGGSRKGAGRNPSKIKTAVVAARLPAPMIDEMKSKGYTATEALKWAIQNIEPK